MDQWKLPSDGIYKLNVDGAKFIDCTAAVIRNVQGQVMVVVTVMAIMRALKIACETGFANLTIESDSLIVINGLKSTDHDLAPFGNVLPAVRAILDFNGRIRDFVQVRHHTNMVDHLLSKHAKIVNEQIV